jgi:hypothetical protein
MKRALFLLLTALFLRGSPGCAQDLLLGNEDTKRCFIILLSGRVGPEKFSGVKGLLTLSHPGPLSQNDYQLRIEPFPRRNSRNCLYWDSEESVMTAFSTEITCDIKRFFVHQPDIHFFYLSPVLLEERVFVTQREDERRKLAEKTALPTKVMASSGRLRIHMGANQVRGRVVMKGYDTVDHAYVEYFANFVGKMSPPRKASQELRD